MTTEEYLTAAGVILALAAVLGPYFVQDRREKSRRIAEAAKAGWANVREYGSGVIGEWDGQVVRHTCGLRDEGDYPSSTEILASGLPRILIIEPSSPLAIDNFVLRMVGRERPPLLTTNDPVINNLFEIYATSEEAVQRIVSDSALVKGLRKCERLTVGADGIEVQMTKEDFGVSWDVAMRVYRALSSHTRRA